MSQDASEDVNDFLTRVRELGSQRDREDEERARKLEQDILQGRKERQARRAERARSISPEKSLSNSNRDSYTVTSPSTAATNTAGTTPTSSAVINPPVEFTPSKRDTEEKDTTTMDKHTSRDDALAKLGGGTPSPAAASFSSWRQARKGGGDEERKADATPTATPKQTDTDGAKKDDEETPSKSSDNDIFTSTSKPETPRPTSSRAGARVDAATSFAAFRKAREDRSTASPTPAKSATDAVPPLTPTPATKPAGLSPTTRLGRERAKSTAAEKKDEKETDVEPMPKLEDTDPHPQPPPSPSRVQAAATTFGGSRVARSNSRFGTNGTQLPFGRARLNSRASQHGGLGAAGEGEIAMSPSQTRLTETTGSGMSADGRPGSPTKGAGGFVQSAMMRRSESAKRLSNAGGHSHRPSVSSRPGSSHAQNDDEHGHGQGHGHHSSLSRTGTPTRPRSLLLRRSESISSANGGGDRDGATSPTKRWSPTKASWLESALNRPESPTKGRQGNGGFNGGKEPEWKQQIARLKANKAAVKEREERERREREGGKEGGGETEKKEKEDGEEKRKSDPPARPEKSATLRRSLEKLDSPAPSASPSTPTPAPVPAATEPASAEKKDKDKDEKKDEKPDDKKKPADLPPKPPGITNPNTTTTTTTNTNPALSRLNSLNSINKPKSLSPSTPNKPRESPSQFDFRANLRRRDPPAEPGRRPSTTTLGGGGGAAGGATASSQGSGQPNEFQNVFAKLKRTNTGHGTSPTIGGNATATATSPSPHSPTPSAAPFKDDFKDNITRGKASLAQSGGPKKSERVDEFRESLRVQRESIREAKGVEGPVKGVRGRAGSVLERKENGVPEALARRRALKSSVDLRGSAREREKEGEKKKGEEEKKGEEKGKPVAPAGEKKPAVTGLGIQGRKDEGEGEKEGKDVKEEKEKEEEKPSEPSEAPSKPAPETSPKENEPPSISPLLNKAANSIGLDASTLSSSSTSRPLAPALANRLNPGLAGILSRGPPPASETSSSARASPASFSSSSSASRSVGGGSGIGRSVSSEEPGSGPALTHMTKGRAKGPKRRAPKAVSGAGGAGKQATSKDPPAKEAPTGKQAESNGSASTPTPTPLAARISKLRNGVGADEAQAKAKAEPATEAKTAPPPVAKKSENARRISDNLSQRSSAEYKPVGGKESDGEKTPPPVPVHKKPSLEFKEKEGDGEKTPPPVPVHKKPSLEFKEKAAPSPLSAKSLQESKPSPPLSKKPSLEFKPSPTSATAAAKPELPTRTSPLAPSISSRLNAFQGPPTPLKTLRKAPTWGGKSEEKPPTPPKDSLEKPKKSPPPLRSSSSSIQLNGKDGGEMPPLTKARTWGAINAVPPVAEKKPDVNVLPLRKNREVGGKDGPPLPRKASSSVSETIAAEAASPGTNVDPKKQSRRRPTPLQLKALPTLPIKPVVPVKPIPSPQTSPFPERQVACTLFTSFFDQPPRAEDKVFVDPVLFFEATEGDAKVRTLSMQLWELQKGGTKKSLPVNQEHILFEECMYLCVHTFENANGAKSTEAVLWAGDEVAQSAFDDTQAFARKIAKEHNAKLEVVHQGREPATFVQTLGGILIVRRGSSRNALDSSPYMLCGRRHSGQIVFDEVDLSAKTLCSGYPFIISTKKGTIYLWEGRGSTADELGCARLIAMDLGLTGEMQEVIEDQEPPEFWSAFPDADEIKGEVRPDYWKHKPGSEKFNTRLFRVDHDRGRRSGFWGRRGDQSPVKRNKAVVQEIRPYIQRDLDPSHIHIVDAFFEIFVIVGEKAYGRSAEFATALVFAQEYGIMAVSMEDKPFLPHTSVALYGFPDEAKKAFRKWTDEPAVTGRKVPDIISLRAATEAIRSRDSYS